MEKLKMGIIGVGGIAQERHIPAYYANDLTEITAVQDVDQMRAREVAEKWHIPHMTASYEELFSFVDAVTICTPNKFHAEIAIAALKAGVHVLCEKPMAMTKRECNEMIQAAKKSGKQLSIAYHYRHTDAARAAKAAIEDGAIGDPLVVRVRAMRQRKVPGWGVFTNKELQGGGSLIDYGCHLLDTALWLLNEPVPKEVMGTAYNRLSKMENQLNEWGSFDRETFEVDDHVTSYITFQNGLSMLFECSWAANIKEDTMHLSISGADGGMNVYPFEIYKPEHGMLMTSKAHAEHDETKAGIRQAQNFVESCLGIAELIVKPEEAMRVSELMEAIYQSSDTGRSVRI